MKLNNKELNKIRKYAEKVLKDKGTVVSDGVGDSWSIFVHDGSGCVLRVKIDDICMDY